MEGFSKEGRKLRPRKTQGVPSEKVHVPNERPAHEGAERVPYREGSRPHGEHGHREGGPRGFRNEHGSREGGYKPRRTFAPREGQRPYGERPAAGERREDGRPAYGNRPGRSGGFSKDPGSGFGGKRMHGKPRPGTPYFSKEASEGMDRMVSRRSSEDRRRAESEERRPEVIKNEIRLNKFIANSGVCSRREADTLIQAGVVTVNGQVVTELGTKVNIFEDDIRFNGERLKGEDKVYIVMNKPRGFVTTASDPHAEKTVLDLMKNCKERVYPVGRLDKATTGVLMLTNDGEIAERLTHPAYDKKKIYQVSLDKALGAEDFQKIMDGIILEDGEIRADALEYIDENDKRKIGIEIHSGRNRIVRRIFEHLGYCVKALDRVYFAGLTKKGLKKGQWRYLGEQEINILKMGAYL
ncbi:MAG: pseudouridine synthase [Bacteroidales bacterium]|nr:pseudouridine synthase [Bacteroidales bacterium]